MNIRSFVDGSNLLAENNEQNYINENCLEETINITPFIGYGYIVNYIINNKSLSSKKCKYLYTLIVYEYLHVNLVELWLRCEINK